MPADPTAGTALRTPVGVRASTGRAAGDHNLGHRKARRGRRAPRLFVIQFETQTFGVRRDRRRRRARAGRACCGPHQPLSVSRVAAATRARRVCPPGSRCAEAVRRAPNGTLSVVGGHVPAGSQLSPMPARRSWRPGPRCSMPKAEVEYRARTPRGARGCEPCEERRRRLRRRSARRSAPATPMRPSATSAVVGRAADAGGAPGKMSRARLPISAITPCGRQCAAVAASLARRARCSSRFARCSTTSRQRRLASARDPRPGLARGGSSATFTRHFWMEPHPPATPPRGGGAPRTAGCRRFGGTRARAACPGAAARRTPSRPRTVTCGRRRLEAQDRELLAAAESERLAALPGRELQRQNAHHQQVRAVDALVALGEHGADAQKRGPLAAQSREEPEPYSLPASTISGSLGEVAPERRRSSSPRLRGDERSAALGAGHEQVA